MDSLLKIMKVSKSLKNQTQNIELFIKEPQIHQTQLKHTLKEYQITFSTILVHDNIRTDLFL